MSHSKKHAEDKLVQCDLGCGQDIRAKVLAFHKRDLCELRHVQCPLCHTVMAAKDEAAHDAHCPKMFTSCKWCHELVARECIIRRELPAHNEQSLQNHMALLNTALEDIHDIIGGGGRLQSTGVDESPPSELPSGLWPKVQAAMINEISGTGASAVDERSIYERIANLESESNNNKQAVDKVTKLEKDNKKLSDTVEKLTCQIDTLVNNTESLESRIKHMLEYGIPKTRTMVRTDEIVQDKCYRLPVYWTCKLKKDKWSGSALFYLTDGYRVELRSEWHCELSTFGVGVRLRKGVNDDRPGMWPWCGDDMMLEVRDKNTGEVLGEEVVRGRHTDEELSMLGNAVDTGRTRPEDEVYGNGCFLVWKILPVQRDRTVLVLTIKRSK